MNVKREIDLQAFDRIRDLGGLVAVMSQREALAWLVKGWDPSLTSSPPEVLPVIDWGHTTVGEKLLWLRHVQSATTFTGTTAA